MEEKKETKKTIRESLQLICNNADVLSQPSLSLKKKNLKQEWLLAFWNKIQTHNRFKR